MAKDGGSTGVVFDRTINSDSCRDVPRDPSSRTPASVVGAMTTEAAHGAEVVFDATLSGGVFWATVVGRYTTNPSRGAGGVIDYEYASNQSVKRRAELLVLRSCFLDWWLKEWVALGGDPAEGVAAWREYPMEQVVET